MFLGHWKSGPVDIDHSLLLRTPQLPPIWGENLPQEVDGLGVPHTGAVLGCASHDTGLPTHPCCGEADAYWCDDYYVRDGHTFCKITDDRPDEPLKRPHVPVGTEIAIPDYRMKHSDGNPTGHTIVFLKPLERVTFYDPDIFPSFGNNDYLVYCFVLNGGV